MAPNLSYSPIISSRSNLQPSSRPSGRVERWTLQLQPYDLKIVYIPGKQNVADSLSRLLPADPNPSHHHGADDYVRFVTHESVPNPMSLSEVEEATIQDEELTEVKQAIQSGRFEKCKSYMPVSGELCISGQLVLRGTRIVLPSKLRPRALALAHEGHLGIVGTKQNLRSKVYWPAMDKAAEKHCKSCHGCQLVAQPDPPEPIRSTPQPDAPMAALSSGPNGTLSFRPLYPGRRRLLQSLLRVPNFTVHNNRQSH